jgi:hypothetical protein
MHQLMRRLDYPTQKKGIITSLRVFLYICIGNLFMFCNCIRICTKQFEFIFIICIRNANLNNPVIV